MRGKRLASSLFVALGVVLALLLGSAAQGEQPPAAAPTPQPTVHPLVDDLKRATGGTVRVSHHSGTGKVRFVGVDAQHPIPRPGPVAADAPPEQAARGFLARYGELFGLTDQARELTVMRSKQADRGRSFVRFQQVHQGVPVVGGELVVQVDGARQVLSANGEVLPGPTVGVVPTVGADAARQKALELVARDYGLGVDKLTTTEPALWVYNPVLLGAPGPQTTSLVWRLEVRPVDLAPIDELVLVDAHRGFVALRFNQVDTALYRQVYDNQNNRSYGLPGNGPVRVEGGPASGVADVNLAYDYAGDTYSFYYSNHGRDSLDDAGMPIVSTVRYCPSSISYTCPYPNAAWISQYQQIVYGEGYSSADDVVGHELTHGVTSYESNLFYYMQSGAINESLSDIWGELIDQTNGKGNDTPTVKWLMGEDLPGGAGRNMADPPNPPNPCGVSPCNPRQPDRMTSPYYYGGEGDNGGVHYNSGVANKAAYLVSDGGSFNGKTVTGLGITKVAKIWYEVQTSLFTSASDYQDLYDDLQQACANLTGTSGITAADCQQVKNAVDATEMSLQPTSAPAPEAPVCSAGQSPVNLFFDDMENPASGKWAFGAIAGASQWDYATGYATSGQSSLYGYDQPNAADYYAAIASGVALPAGSTPYLHFRHAYAFDAAAPPGTSKYDGGVVEYSANGGPWTDAGPLFVDNGYTGTIASGSGNPLQGRQAFVGKSNGYMSSRAGLSVLAGQSVRFRFRIGTNSTVENLGWLVDDVRIFTCTGTGSPTPTSRRVYLPLVMRGDAASGWVTIASEDFEGAFPGSWQLVDPAGSTWGKRSCASFAGSYSGWAVGGGANGTALSCGSNYPNNVTSAMIHGPFSLVGATAGDLKLKVWQNTLQASDLFCVLASTNGSNFWGDCYSGSTGGTWQEVPLNLKNVYSLGNLMGQPNVWVALYFETDASMNTSVGAYADNVVLRKCTAASCPGALATTPDVGAAGLVRTTKSIVLRQ